MFIKKFQFDVFDRFFYRIALILAALCVVFAGAVWARGGRIHQAEYDATALVTATNSQMLLHTTEAVGTVTSKNVRITPTVPFVAAGNGTKVLLKFGNRLQSETTYTITVDTSGSPLRYSFKTGSAPFYYLKKGTQQSEIHQRTGSKDTVIYEGRVSDYVALNGAVAVSVQSTSANKKVLIINTRDKTQHEIPLPATGIVEAMRVSPDRTSFGFIFTASDISSPISKHLLVYKVAAKTLTTVNGLGGEPAQVSDWQFAPDSTTVAAQAPDGTTLLLDSTNTQQPAPLGQFATLEGFTADGSALIVDSVQEGVLSIDRKTLAQQNLSSSFKTSDALMQAMPLVTRPGFILRYSSATGGNTGRVVLKESGKQTTLLSIGENANAYITEIAIAPNDSYAAITISHNDGSDEAAIINTHTGQQTMRVTGTDIMW